jgi:hypothetical protein
VTDCDGALTSINDEAAVTGRESTLSAPDCGRVPVREPKDVNVMLLRRTCDTATEDLQQGNTYKDTTRSYRPSVLLTVRRMPGSVFIGLVNPKGLLDSVADPDTAKSLVENVDCVLRDASKVRDAVLGPNSSSVSMNTSPPNKAVPSTARCSGRLFISDTNASGTRDFARVNVNDPSC